MKKKLAFTLALLLLLLAGCDTKLQTATEPSVSPPDSNLDYNEFMNWSKSWAVTEQGYYILTNEAAIPENNTSYFLYFMNQDLTAITPVCGRPECNHRNKACDALVDTRNIFYHNDSLYYIGISDTGKRGIYQMSLTGQNRHLVKKLDFLNASDSYGISVNKCGSYLVVSYDAPDITEGNNRTIYLASLDTDDASLPIFGESSNKDEASYTVFKTVFPWVLALGGDAEHGVELWGYNIETQEYRLIMDYWQFDVVADLYVSEQEMDWFVRDDGFYRLDLKTGETRKLRNADPAVEQGGGAYDDQYIYLNNATPGVDKLGTVPPEQRGLHIYDLEANQLAFLSADGLDFHLTYAFTTADRVFFCNFDAGSVIPIYYIEKDKIPTGELAWIPIEASGNHS